MQFRVHSRFTAASAETWAETTRAHSISHAGNSGWFLCVPRVRAPSSRTREVTLGCPPCPPPGRSWAPQVEGGWRKTQPHGPLPKAEPVRVTSQRRAVNPCDGSDRVCNVNRVIWTLSLTFSPPTLFTRQPKCWQRLLNANATAARWRCRPAGPRPCGHLPEPSSHLSARLPTPLGRSSLFWSALSPRCAVYMRHPRLCADRSVPSTAKSWPPNLYKHLLCK